MVRWQEGVKMGGDTERGKGVDKCVGEGKGVGRGGDRVTRLLASSQPHPQAQLSPSGCWKVTHRESADPHGEDGPRRAELLLKHHLGHVRVQVPPTSESGSRMTGCARAGVGLGWGAGRARGGKRRQT